MHYEISTKVCVLKKKNKWRDWLRHWQPRHRVHVYNHKVFPNGLPVMLKRMYLQALVKVESKDLWGNMIHKYT